MKRIFNFFKKKTPDDQKLICWFEIPVYDFKRGLQFYSKVFKHLKFDITEFNGIGHAIFKPLHSAGGFSVNGALVHYERKKEGFGGSILFFDANSGMEEILKRVEQFGGTIIKGKSLIKNRMENGATVIPKNSIDGKMGYYAYFIDSEGNQIGLYSHG